MPKTPPEDFELIESEMRKTVALRGKKREGELNYTPVCAFANTPISDEPLSVRNAVKALEMELVLAKD